MGHCGGLKKGSRQAKSDHPTATEASIGHCGGRERKALYPRCLAAFPRAEQGQAYVPFVRLGAVVAKNLISWIFSHRERLRHFWLRGRRSLSPCRILCPIHPARFRYGRPAGSKGTSAP